MKTYDINPILTCSWSICGFAFVTAKKNDFIPSKCGWWSAYFSFSIEALAITCSRILLIKASKV